MFNRFYCSILTQNPPFTSQPLRFLSSHRSLNPALVIWCLCVTLVELKGQRKPRRRAATASSLISSERLKKTQRKTEKLRSERFWPSASSFTGDAAFLPVLLSLSLLLPLRFFFSPSSSALRAKMAAGREGRLVSILTVAEGGWAASPGVRLLLGWRFCQRKRRK